MKIYHLNTCDTCRAARKALPEALLVEIREDGISKETLTAWLAALGAETLINKKSKTWRALDDAEKSSDPLTLLLQHPTLMKRPVIERDGDLFVGWGADTKAALLD